jgi:UDPglucose 6-dehydrogenase
MAAADVIYIAVGTPGLPDGRADLRGVVAVSEQIGAHMARVCTVVIKSTVPVGTADLVREIVGRSARFDFDVVSNPEFLKEGAAIEDFTHPDRIVIGCRSPRSRQVMGELYAGLVRSGRPILFMDNRSAELTKYASNALLATKISFMNELSRLCERLGADIEDVRKGTGSDSRIGPRFLFAGPGYGGSCFPKDVKALVDMGKQAGLPLKIATAVEDVNAEQKQVLARKVLDRFGPDLSGRCFAILGLAFKPETDDIREAPALVIIGELLAAGATVRVYDPEAMAAGRLVLGDTVTWASGMDAAVDGADAMVLVTEWNEFRHPDFPAIKEKLRAGVVFDGRNIYDPATVRAVGLEYHGIGRL